MVTLPVCSLRFRGHPPIRAGLRVLALLTGSSVPPLGGEETPPDHSGICIWKRFLESCPSKGPSVILDTLALWGVTLNDVHLPQGRGLRARSEADVGLIPINYF